jgi:hypothetical protein
VTTGCRTYNVNFVSGIRIILFLSHGALRALLGRPSLPDGIDLKESSGNRKNSFIRLQIIIWKKFAEAIYTVIMFNSFRIF